MRACGLHAIGTLLTSQAVLIRPVTPHARSNQSLIRLIVSRIRGVIAASQYVLCQYNIHRDDLAEAIKVTPGRRAATVTPLQDEGWSAISAMVKKSDVATVMDRLEEVGGTDIFTLALDVSVCDAVLRYDALTFPNFLALAELPYIEESSRSDVDGSLGLERRGEEKMVGYHRIDGVFSKLQEPLHIHTPRRRQSSQIAWLAPSYSLVTPLCAERVAFFLAALPLQLPLSSSSSSSSFPPGSCTLATSLMPSCCPDVDLEVGLHLMTLT